MKTLLNLKYADIGYKINGAIFEVNKVLGPGLTEKVYQKALVYELRKRGFEVEEEKLLSVKYKDAELDLYYRADIVVNGAVIVELKAVTAITGSHIAQLLNYLKVTHLEYGILVNFYESKAEIHHYTNDNSHTRPTECEFF